MGGGFSKANRPKLHGAFFNFESRVVPAIPAAPGSVVCVPFTHDWGPLEEAVRTRSFGEWQAIFGGSDDTPGYRAVRQAFLGESIDGRGGAGEVLSYRLGGSTAAKAVRSLQNTTPAAAITLTARYEGSRGNDLRVTTRDHVPDPTKNELILYDGTVELEKYVYANSAIQDLVDQINGDGVYAGQASDWVTAELTVGGVALAEVTAQAFANGNDGSALVIDDWTTALDALDVHDFAVFAPFDLTDSSMLAAARTWVVDNNVAGKRFRAVFGGLAAETPTTAIARSGTLSDPNILNLGVGTLKDLTLGPDGEEFDLSTSQFAPRIAGILAARGEFQSLSGARIRGVEVVTGATTDDFVNLLDEGVVSFARDSDPVAPVFIQTGFTTWTKVEADADPSRPYRHYRNPKYVACMHAIQSDLAVWARTANIFGRGISPATRDAAIAEGQRNLQGRQEQTVIQPGWSVGIDQEPPPTDEDEFIALVLGVKFAPSLEQLYFTIAIS